MKKKMLKPKELIPIQIRIKKDKKELFQEILSRNGITMTEFFEEKIDDLIREEHINEVAKKSQT